MKAAGIIILGGLVTTVLGLFLLGNPAPEKASVTILVPADPSPVFSQCLNEVLPVVSATNPVATEACIAEGPEEIQTPVQPLEERGDALLFEAEALQGMPFDQAVVMPFD